MAKVYDNLQEALYERGKEIINSINNGNDYKLSHIDLLQIVLEQNHALSREIESLRNYIEYRSDICNLNSKAL